jgi:hypothetical protein
VRAHAEIVGERFECDRAALLKLPAAPYEACEKVSARDGSLALCAIAATTTQCRPGMDI